MKQIAFAGRAVAALIFAGAISAFASAASGEDAYEAFVMDKTAPAWATADGGYGSQGFHHGLPESSILPAVEPVAGGADAMHDASIFTYTADPDYGSRNIEHWLPQYRRD